MAEAIANPFRKHLHLPAVQIPQDSHQRFGPDLEIRGQFLQFEPHSTLAPRERGLEERASRGEDAAVDGDLVAVRGDDCGVGGGAGAGPWKLEDRLEAIGKLSQGLRLRRRRVEGGGGSSRTSRRGAYAAAVADVVGIGEPSPSSVHATHEHA